MPLSLTAMAVTLSEVNNYAEARGYTAWVNATTLKTEAMRRAQDYIAGKYNALWSVAFDNASAPTEIKYAIAEAAIRELATPFSLSPDVTLGTAKVLTAVDSLHWTLVKSNAGVDDLRPTLTAIEAILVGFLRPRHTMGHFVV